MAATDLDAFTQGEARFGENVARTQRIIAKLLLDWCSGTDRIEKACNTEERRREHLLAIYFDKLAALFCRLWDELHSRDKVRYPASLTKRRGFHGPGRALVINRANDADIGIDADDHRQNRWAFTTELAQKLHPTLGQARSLFVVSGESWKHTCKVAPGIVGGVWEAWLEEDSNDNESLFLLPYEVRIVESLSKVITALSDDELRALGTHCNAQETVADIKFNLSSWAERFEEVNKLLLEEAAGVPTRSINADRAAYVLASTAREVKRKSKENRQVYGAALQKAMAVCDCDDLRSVLKAVQKDPASLWESDDLQPYVATAEVILDFSVYIRRGLYDLGHISELSSREVSESETASGRLVHPFPNVSLPLPGYTTILQRGAAYWGTSLAECKNTIFSLMPPIRDLGGYGIPN